MNLIKALTAASFIVLSASTSIAQTYWSNPEVEQKYNKAKEQLSNGKYDQAIILYKQVISEVPESIEANAGLARSYQLSKLNKEAIAHIQPFLLNSTANEQMYQTLGVAYAALNKTKDQQRALEQGIERYPSSGLLHYEYGKALDAQLKPEEALKAFVKGIQMDPEFHVNYYEAAYKYFKSNQPYWCYLYSEIFLSKEKLTPRANDARIMMKNSLKNFFEMARTMQFKEDGSANTFDEAVEETLLKVGGMLADGYTTDNLTMMRIRFAMHWKKHYAQKFPFSLFQMHNSLIGEGLFEVYNHQLFTLSTDKQAQSKWEAMHPKQLSELEDWMKHYKFKMGINDHYNKMNVVLPKENKKSKK